MSELVIDEASRTEGQAAEPSVAVPTMDLPRFLRLYQMRTGQIMWFLGAGASRAAGIKTAWDVIWDLKQKLYCSQKKLPLSTITDLSDPGVQRQLQAHFDAMKSLPPAGAEEEYSGYFEAAYPSAKDRRSYLDNIITSARPSFGHRALAMLMREGIVRIVWTTNFDKLVEDSAAKIFESTGRLVVADLGEPEKLDSAIQASRWPVLGKLHGDFHSERLKNTTDELRSQDEAMRAAFVTACQNGGLAVTGYSGRDLSILEALSTAIASGRGFPGGLYWFKRAGETPFQGVVDLLAAATRQGIEAHFVEVETFDEVMSDIVRFLPATAAKVDDIGEADRPRLGKVPVREPGNKFPVVRTNALPLIAWPASCRLAVCTIGGVSDVLKAVADSNVDLDVNRVRAGVIAFGRDADLKKALANHQITSLETYAISPKRLSYESGERTIIRDALCRALRNRPGLIVERRGRGTVLFADPDVVQPALFNSISGSMNQLSGRISPVATWQEACEVRLDWRFGRLWLLLEPRVILDTAKDIPEDALNKARDFVRERRAQRRNRQTNSVLDGWIRLIAGEGETIRLRSFGISDGIDADFEIARTTGYSGRAAQ